MSKVVLPPLPAPVNKHGFNCIQTLDQLCARDLEVARVALEAAAFHLRGADKHLTNLQISDQIRALEFTHE